MWLNDIYTNDLNHFLLLSTPHTHTQARTQTHALTHTHTHTHTHTPSHHRTMARTKCSYVHYSKQSPRTKSTSTRKWTPLRPGLLSRTWVGIDIIIYPSPIGRWYHPWTWIAYPCRSGVTITITLDPPVTSANPILSSSLTSGWSYQASIVSRSKSGRLLQKKCGENSSSVAEVSDKNLSYVTFYDGLVDG